MLLNFTKKKWTKDFFPSQLPRTLLHDPFCRAVSRVSYKPDLFRFELCAEFIPDLLERKIDRLTWTECCDRRALELLKLDREKYLVSWSGGIDSTTMMISLMRTWSPRDLKRVKVLLSHSSIFENPRFFDRVISSFAIGTSVGDISGELRESGALLLTGELGDQLFGSDIMEPAVRAFGDDVLRRGYEDWAPKVIDRWTRVEGSGRAIFDRFAPIVDESPVPVKTVFDFFWWMNFSQKWQHVKYRFVEQAGWDLDMRYGKSVLHFFDTPEFQHWSVRNHDLKIGTDWMSYKRAAKDFIVDFTKNSDDHLQRKIPSLALRNFLVEKRIAVTSDYKAIRTEEELAPYVRSAK